MQKKHSKILAGRSYTPAGGSSSECFKVVNGYSQQANGSHYQKEVVTSYGELINIFGKPSCGESGDGKVQVEWIVIFGDGRLCTIYDWKEYDTPVGSVTNWHLGGHDGVGPNRIKEIIKNGISS